MIRGCTRLVLSRSLTETCCLHADQMLGMCSTSGGVEQATSHGRFYDTVRVQQAHQVAADMRILPLYSFILLRLSAHSISSLC